MLLEEVVPTYQERLASYIKTGTSGKLLEEDVANVSGTSCKLLQEELQRIRNIWQVTYRRCYNVAGTFCKFLVFAQEHERYLRG